MTDTALLTTTGEHVLGHRGCRLPTQSYPTACGASGLSLHVPQRHGTCTQALLQVHPYLLYVHSLLNAISRLTDAGVRAFHDLALLAARNVCEHCTLVLGELLRE